MGRLKKKVIKKTCKYVYKLYLENIKESSLRSQNKWAQELGIQIDDWGYIYSSINKKNTIITIFVNNKNITISFNIKIKPNGLTQDVVDLRCC
jgi:hypothetical protein